MIPVPAPDVFPQFFNATATAPLVGGLLFTYRAGTSTKQATYTDATALTLNANPIVLDSAGMAAIWVDPSLSYKFVLAPANDTDPPTSPLRTQDNVTVSFNIGNVPFYPQTPAEVTAGVVPVSLLYLVGDIRRYGAALDGVTDDTVAITNWAKVGGNLTFPLAATAKITAPISLVSKTKIEAVPGATIRQYTANTDVLQATNQNDIAIRNLTFYACGTLTSIYNGCGINATGCTYINVRDCTITNHRGYGILFNNSSHCVARFNRLINSPVVNSDLHSNCAGDIAIEGNSSYCRVIGNECISGNGIGIQCQTITLGDNNSYNIIVNNLVADCKIYGLLAYAMNAFSDTMVGNSFIDNVITRISGAVAHATNGYVYGNGIYAVDNDDLLIKGNNISKTHSAAVTFIDQLAPGAIGVTNCGRVSIIGNICDTDVMYGIAVRDPGAIGPVRQQTLVSGNNVSNIAGQVGTGIQILTKANCKVEGNTVDTVASVGITFTNSALANGNSCNNNVVRNAGASGITFSYCSTFSCCNNTVWTVASHGIYGDHSQDVSMVGNVIALQSGYGIGLDTVLRYTLEGNIVTGTGSSVGGYYLNSRWALSRSNLVTLVATQYLGGYGPYATAAPAALAWLQGDIVWNSNPLTGNYIGWVCIAGGTPGTWKTYGIIS